jgi:fumarate reductase flavoprotein subunit
VSVSFEAGVDFDAAVPVVIIGGGAAGLTAALACAEAGIEAVVLERDHRLGGSTALSAGLVPAAGTRWQQAAGIEDSPTRFVADLHAKAKHQADPAVVETLATGAAPTLHWLADRHGLLFSLLKDVDYPGHSARRMHGLPSRAGHELLEALAAAVPLPIVTDARATTLHANPDGRVRGLAFARPDGSLERLGCTALILACGGFGGDRELVGRHLPALADALYFGHPGHRGEALRWGEGLGAALADLAGHQGHGSVAEPAAILLTWAVITAGGFQVNRAGERFWDESQGYSEAARAVLAQPDGLAWCVFDSRGAGIARQFADYRALEAAGAVLHAGSPLALAAAARLPPAAFAASCAAVAAAKAAGARDRFGRDWAGVAPLVPPLHAVRVTGALFHTQGGIAVDAEGRALRPDGRPLPNLFAAGGAARGVSGPDPAGYLSGNGLLSAVVLGRLAGIAAARLVGSALTP